MENQIERLVRNAVKSNVKTAVILAVVTIMAILVVAEVIALSDTANFPMASAVPNPGKVNLMLPSVMRPVTYYGDLPPHTLEPGVYEVQPYATMLKVPNPATDNCVIHESAPSPIPVVHPELKSIPKVSPILHRPKNNFSLRTDTLILIE
jgi:hypothetical protein